VHEAMPASRWLGFGLVWLALAVFTGDALRNAHGARRQTTLDQAVRATV